MANALSIAQTKEKHKHEWLKLPYVVSVGLALDESGEEVIALGLSQLDTTLSCYPDCVEGYKVVLQQVGSPKAF